MKKAWYVFMGGKDPYEASNYFKLTVVPGCLCGDRICAIYTTDSGLRLTGPLSDHLQTYIKAALATGMLQPEKPFNTKKYVYLKL